MIYYVSLSLFRERERGTIQQTLEQSFSDALAGKRSSLGIARRDLSKSATRAEYGCGMGRDRSLVVFHWKPREISGSRHNGGSFDRSLNPMRISRSSLSLSPFLPYSRTIQVTTESNSRGSPNSLRFVMRTDAVKGILWPSAWRIVRKWIDSAALHQRKTGGRARRGEAR